MDRSAAVEQKLRQIEIALERNAPIHVVHYACENFNALKDRPVCISCIAIGGLDGESREAFSLIDTPLAGDLAEKSEDAYILRRYFDFLKNNQPAYWIHWNMNSPDYGFGALEKRYAYVFKQEPPLRLPPERCFDLDELIKGRYGHNYADHPRLYNMAKLNDYHLTHFLFGKDEAERFERKEHGEVRRSVNEKVKLVAYLAERLLTGRLETKHYGPRVGFAGSTLDAVRTVIGLGERFWDVSRQMRRRHKDRPTLELNDEYDAQDLFHSLLRIFFDDIRPEDPGPEVAGAATRIDFVLPVHRLAIELKFTRDSMSKKSLGDDLINDAHRYAERKELKYLVCLVFDGEGRLENPRGLERDLSGEQKGMMIQVRIYDRGNIVGTKKADGVGAAGSKPGGPAAKAQETK